MQNTVKSMPTKGISQFELTSNLLRNLNKFNLTPVTKLVLLELTTHLNDNKNGSVVFPSVNYISEVLGIGLTATKQAIKDLINEGLIIKSKRSKVSGNCNKYLITPKVRNLTSERSQNELSKKSKSDLFMITNKEEQNKKQKYFSFQKNWVDPDRYKTNALEHIKKIKNEVVEQVSSDYFKNVRERFL
jgi:DNA-binding MarR family transcriptional regulator